VTQVDDAIEVLTGWPAGDTLGADPATLNGRIVMRLREYATLRRGPRRHARPRGVRAVQAEAHEARDAREPRRR
jgi:hypothetical protein